MKRAFVAGSKAHIKRNVTNLESESLQSEGIVRGACSGAHWMSHRLQHDNECLCNQCRQKHSLTGSAGVWGVHYGRIAAIASCPRGEFQRSPISTDELFMTYKGYVTDALYKNPAVIKAVVVVKAVKTIDPSSS